MKASCGKIVAYTLDAQDALSVNKRRHDAGISGISREETGAQVHVGNSVDAGDVFPAMIVKVWNDDVVNLQVHLDGNDLLWVTSAPQGDGEHQWHLFPMV